MNQDHDHHHTAPQDFSGRFALGIALNIVFVAIEAFYGWRAGSLALLADAAHNLGGERTRARHLRPSRRHHPDRAARRGAIDLHDRRDDSAPEAAALQLPPRSALPFLITLELLSIERAVLQGLYGRLTHAAPRSIGGLIGLKKDVMGGLEEYYGSTLARTRFNDVVAEQGEDVLGIVDLFEAETDRLDMVR